jgi:hypothetical protein
MRRRIRPAATWLVESLTRSRPPPEPPLLAPHSRPSLFSSAPHPLSAVSVIATEENSTPHTHAVCFLKGRVLKRQEKIKGFTELDAVDLAALSTLAQPERDEEEVRAARKQQAAEARVLREEAKEERAAAKLVRQEEKEAAAAAVPVIKVQPKKGTKAAAKKAAAKKAASAPKKKVRHPPSPPPPFRPTSITPPPTHTPIPPPLSAALSISVCQGHQGCVWQGQGRFREQGEQKGQGEEGEGQRDGRYPSP